MEVRSAVVYATVIVVLAFLPVFFLTGLAGAFFRPLAAAYILAILASLVVALTVTPAMSLLLLPASARQRTIDGPLVRGFKSAYRRILSAALRSSLGDAWRDRDRVLVVGRLDPVSRRTIDAKVPRDRLPDALGREARNRNRCDGPDHACEPARN